jgi:predicted ATP-dependent endonuclease of OLD family
MYISRITVRNFRLLKDFSIDLEESLSLVIGKNNSGKTSLLQLMDKMLNRNSGPILYNDFNLDYREDLLNRLCEEDTIQEDNFIEDGVSLRLFIHYSDADDLDCLGKILMDLDVDNFTAVLGYDFYLSYEGYLELRKELSGCQGQPDNVKKARLDKLLSTNLNKYFSLKKKSLAYDQETHAVNENNYIDLKKRTDFHEEELISFAFIDARRRVDNKDNENTLSAQTSELYEKMSNELDAQNVEQFEKTIQEADEKFTGSYEKLFNEIVGKVSEMGGMTEKETQLKIISDLQKKELLKGNTKVVYNHGNYDLPESYNGLGYMNLISMIFQIEIIRKRFIHQHGRMADINLLIIEEPEAHTHPQMQYVFIRNIKKLLNLPLVLNGKQRKIQSIISSHSAHIVSASDFNDLKYFVRIGNENKVIAKNLKDLEKEYENETEYFSFLKKYLTNTRSELFFANKAIFIEGDTERILLPVMMKKLDQEEPVQNGERELTQQNISVIEVGAYSQIFGKFINFIGLEKALVITDLDIAENEGHHKKQRYIKDAIQCTTNSALKAYFPNEKISDLLTRTDNYKIFKWNEENHKWKQDSSGTMRVCFQVEEEGYQARSFEDGFFHINKEFLCEFDNSIGLSMNLLKQFKEGSLSQYDFAEQGIESKASFAVEILYNSKNEGNSDYANWKIPKYIKEGLLWIRK